MQIKSIIPDAKFQKPVSKTPDLRHPPFHTHTHTIESKETRNWHSRMQGKLLFLQKFPCEECKQEQKSSHTGKIRKQKTR